MQAGLAVGTRMQRTRGMLHVPAAGVHMLELLDLTDAAWGGEKQTEWGEETDPE